MRYILGIVGLIIILILAITLIVTRSPGTPTQQGKKAVVLSDYADKDATVTFSTRGKIVGEESFRSVRIAINPHQRTVEILHGYENAVGKSQSYDNTQAAYSTFVHALDKAGFTREKRTSIDNPTGICPLGHQFNYLLSEGGAQKINLWNTNCNSDGSFGGNSSLVMQLFQAQIPDYSKFVSGLVW